MKQLLILLVVALAAVIGYQYLQNNPATLTSFKSPAQGSEQPNPDNQAGRTTPGGDRATDKEKPPKDPTTASDKVLYAGQAWIDRGGAPGQNDSPDHPVRRVSCDEINTTIRLGTTDTRAHNAWKWWINAPSGVTVSPASINWSERCGLFPEALLDERHI